jgi:hypothetical protein
MVFGITRSLNEDDVVEFSLRRMCLQVDHVLVGDNSTDGTRGIIDALIADGLPITLLEDTAKNFEQREVMTAYAQLARDMGATWGVFFDIDEAWYADGGRITDVLADLPEHILLAPARNLTHCVTDQDDLGDADPMNRMGWRSVEMLPLVKVACRLRADLEIGHGNHSAHYGDERHTAAINDLLESRHFPYRSPEQLIKRVTHAYPMLKASGLPRSHGLHMWEMGEHWEEYGDAGLRRWFANGMHFEDPASNPELVHDPLPELVESPCL